MSHLFPFLIMSGFVLFAAIAVLAYLADKKRREALRALAGELGFTFLRTDAELPDRLAGLQLFKRGRSRRATNVLEGTAQGIEVALFDYQYTTGSGKNSHTYRQTVIAFWSQMLNLPDFELHPQNIFHSIAKVFGYQDIDFDANPGFSRHYLLRGSFEAAVRAAFDDQVRSWYESHPGVSTEGAGDCVVFYGSGRRLRPQKWRGFMQQGFEVFALFARS